VRVCIFFSHYIAHLKVLTKNTPIATFLCLMYHLILGVDRGWGPGNIAAYQRDSMYGLEIECLSAAQCLVDFQ
jgi:hypothetical protein